MSADVSDVSLPQQTYTVGALLAAQRLLRISSLPDFLKIRPQQLGGKLTAAEWAALEKGRVVIAGEVDPELEVILRALARPDAEVRVKLEYRERLDTRMVIVRSGRLVVVAVLCGDEITIDPYTDVTSAEQIGREVAGQIAGYLFATKEPRPVRISPTLVSATAVLSGLAGAEREQWRTSLTDAGIAADVAEVLNEMESAPVARAEVSAALCQVNTYGDSDSVVRVVDTALGAGMTSFTNDNDGQVWLRVEPYDPRVLVNLIAGCVMGVPHSGWFTHQRHDQF
ncbi:ESX secretion-associated protein EspG [Mycobacteroides abscessus]|uniref:ESX secretion-associated protein EspG n=1 Tax=Mycobacteroides abscessus TaxID=36809 RepID=UPI000C2605F2|nr:ESX secretion-associated protein EspG [Mycobacteroides abscessus]RIS77888.1 ESX secretion-associated protein EspG [Mycobacteroides abscessus]